MQVLNLHQIPVRNKTCIFRLLNRKNKHKFDEHKDEMQDPIGASQSYNDIVLTTSEKKREFRLHELLVVDTIECEVLF